MNMGPDRDIRPPGSEPTRRSRSPASRETAAPAQRTAVLRASIETGTIPGSVDMGGGRDATRVGAQRAGRCHVGVRGGGVRAGVLGRAGRVPLARGLRAPPELRLPTGGGGPRDRCPGRDPAGWSLHRRAGAGDLRPFPWAVGPHRLPYVHARARGAAPGERIPDPADLDPAGTPDLAARRVLGAIGASDRCTSGSSSLTSWA